MNDLKRVGLVFDAQGNVDFVKSLKEVNASLRENYNQFKINQAEWTNATKSSEKLAQQQKYLIERYDLQADKVDILKRQLEELNSSEEKNEKAIAKKEKELAQAEVQLKKYGTQLKEINDKLSSSVAKNEELVKSLQNVGNSIENVGKKASILSGAVAAGMVGSVKAAMDFETAFTGVEKTVDGTKEQLDKLKQGIRDLSKEIPSSTTEISAVAEAAGQLGIETDNVLDFTKTMINMGNATNLSATDAATTLARFANVTQMSQKDFDKLGSTIVALGNNFATTESEIAQMGMNLGSAGSQIGMTQPEIMALATALSSVGLEAQAGGTAFSKLMINMQLAVETGSDELEDFAKVAGMSAKDFAAAFKKDATKALLAFIKGLSKSGKQGESAIKVLDDMGITETRLRDSLLRSANASDLFSDAIKLGSDAWDDNTALTKEANKRYDTLKSKLEIVKNKLLDNVVTIGNKLMPVVEKIIDKVSKWTDKLANLNDNQIETILKIGAFIAAAGPLLTVFGKITGAVGDTIDHVSKFRDALKVAHGDMETTDKKVQGLAGVIEKLSTPVGIATTAIGLLAGGIALYKAATEDSEEATRKYIDEMSKSVDAYNDLKEAQENQAGVQLNEIDNTKLLYEELKKITDENGKIKEGYETRANFIVNELKNSLGIEIDLTDGIISNYQDLQKEIEKTIELKRANILLDLSEEKYKTALQEKDKAYQDVLATEQKLAEKKQEINDLEADYDFAVKTHNLSDEIYYKNKIDKAKNSLESLENLYNQEKGIYDNYLKNITDYEEGSAIILSENLEDIQNWANKTQLTMSSSAKDQEDIMSANIQQLSYNIDYYKKLYDQDVENRNVAGQQATKNQLENNQAMLDAVVQSMLEQTSTINENSPEIVNAWIKLANTNRDKYLEVLNELPPGLQRTINEMTGASDKSFDEMGSVLSKKAEETKTKIINPFSDNREMKNTMDYFLSPMSSEMDNYLPVLERKASNMVSGVLNTFKRGFDIHSPARTTQKIFKNVMLGSEKGIESEEDNLYKQVDEVAENVLEGLNAVNSKSSNNYYNSSSNNIGLSIDYNQLYLCFLQALNNCKMKLDEDGFVRIVDDRMREVI